MINIEVAKVDIDRIELNFRQMWNDFFNNNNNNNYKCIINDNNSN